MPTHIQQWSSATPGLIIFLLDQSGSMQKEFQDSESRMNFATKALNRVIDSLIQKNFNGDRPKNRCFVVVIGYSYGAQELCSGMLSDLYDNVKRREPIRKKISDGAGGLVEVNKEMPIWVEPSYEDKWTDMAAAFRMAKQIINQWILDKPESPAPVIINISDGIPYYDLKPTSVCESETKELAKEIMNISTNDGNVLIFNVEIGQNHRIILPASIQEMEIGGDGAKFLFEISSEIPEGYRAAAKANELQPRENSRGAIFGADAEYLIKMIDFGSSKGQHDFN